MRDTEWDDWAIEADRELYGPQDDDDEDADM